MSGEYLVAVNSGSQNGEWFRMAACPIPGYGARQGEYYEKFASHLAAEHRPEDVGLSSDSRRVATDGGTPYNVDTEEIGIVTPRSRIRRMWAGV